MDVQIFVAIHPVVVEQLTRSHSCGCLSIAQIHNGISTIGLDILHRPSWYMHNTVYKKWELCNVWLWQHNMLQKQGSGILPNAKLWTESYVWGLVGKCFAMGVWGNHLHVRAMNGYWDINYFVVVKVPVCPHLGVHSHHKETYQLVVLEAPWNANRMVVVSCKSDKNWGRYGVCSHPYMLPTSKYYYFWVWGHPEAVGGTPPTMHSIGAARTRHKRPEAPRVRERSREMRLQPYLARLGCISSPMLSVVGWPHLGAFRRWVSTPRVFQRYPRFTCHVWQVLGGLIGQEHYIMGAM